MSLAFNGPHLVATPWYAANRNVVQNDAFRFIQRARRGRVPALALRAGLNAITSGVVPIFGWVGQVAHDSAAQCVQTMSIVVDGYRPVANVGAALAFACLDQRCDRPFGRLQFLAGAEGRHGSLRELVCTAMEERVVGGVESPADDEALERRA